MLHSTGSRSVPAGGFGLGKISSTLLRRTRRPGSIRVHGSSLIYAAVCRYAVIRVVCKDFRVRSATLGRDAIGEVNLEVEHKGRTYRGVGVSTDSVESTILAMLNAINRIISEKSPTQNDTHPNA